jgi:hypothetical protein
VESDLASPSKQVIVVRSADGDMQRFAPRLECLGVEVHEVADLGQARTVLDAMVPDGSVLFLPGRHLSPNLKRDLAELTSVFPNLALVAVGKLPDKAERKQLRSAGVRLALWEPFDDGTLRFQLNRAVEGRRVDQRRGDTRIPTYLLARVHVGDRTKDAIVYSLSRSGAFLETTRASMEGARIGVELRLPSRPMRVNAVVVFANVTGNLQRPNLPMGMGVRFTDLDAEDDKAICHYVTERSAQLEI